MENVVLWETLLNMCADIRLVVLEPGGSERTAPDWWQVRHFRDRVASDICVIHCV
jgi:hypothetical protein